MCGITGFLDYKSNSNYEIINDMVSTLIHRGPEGEGKIFKQLENSQLGLGHSRLSIIDLSENGAQPMSFENLSIVFNGEIYNYKEIRTDLIQLGHTFQTNSDTEVILHSWAQWKEAAITRWRGMFAMVLFDSVTGTMYCIRDRAGVKPFYYYQTEDLFIFGSELKAFFRHPDFKAELNLNSVATYMQYGYISWPHSIYLNTFKLPPGHILTINVAKKLKELKQYWNVYDYYRKPKLKISAEDAVLESERVLEESFKYRMLADVPVGIFLSGGYDSTCVTALLQKNSINKIKTFTIGSFLNKVDEAPIAKGIADHLGTDHTEVYCTAKEALDIIPDLPMYYDEPFADSSSIPTVLVSRLARKDVIVALSADAGDEIFLGYDKYSYSAKFGRFIRKTPKGVRDIVLAGMNILRPESLPFLKNNYNLNGRFAKVKIFLRDPSEKGLLKNFTQVFSATEIKSLFNVEISEHKTAHTSKEILTITDDLDKMAAVDFQTDMVDDIMHKVDRATMSVSLEGREPFLDHKIIELAAQIPTNIKLYNGEQKYIIKNIVHKYVPKEKLLQPKMGFDVPVEKWLKYELKDLVYEYLSDEKLKNQKLFDVEYVKNIIQEFYAGKNQRHLQVWHLLMFQMWYSKWITMPMKVLAFFFYWNDMTF